MGKEIKFRPATFYLGIADMLAKEVEGQEEIDGSSDEGHSERNHSRDIAQLQADQESRRASPASNSSAPPSPSSESSSRQPLGERLSAAVQTTKK
jgi:triacylglycerol lipase